MLDVVVIVLLGRELGRMAMKKGLPRGWSALALAVFVPEIAVAFAAGASGLTGMGLAAASWAGLGLGALAAWAVVRGLAPAPGWRPGMRWAGLCRKCNANVWLTEDLKRCEHGHAAGNMKGLYVPDQQRGETPTPSSV